jgi:pyruvate dehydrogenase E2 component (dihydrolipoamide acetyltransferase)
MATKVVMEALSPTMEEGRLVTWLKKEGDTVATGDTLAEVETDKAVMELVARGDGVLRQILVAEGQTVDVASLVAIIAGADEDISSIAAAPPAKTPDAPASSDEPDSSAPVEVETPPTAAPDAGDRVKASPLARKLAVDKGIDLTTVQGSGPAGRIVKKDLDSAKAVPAATVAAPTGGFEDVPLTMIRKTIAKRLAASLGPVPHFFLTTTVDMENVAAARAELNKAGDGKISFNDIIVKAVSMALARHRDCNAWWQDDHIRYFNEVHMSIAVAIEDGLITPVVRNANLKSLREISTETKELVSRAQQRKLAPEEYTGGTFSLSNLGMFGIDQFTAIINPPEAGIIAIGGIMEEAVPYDGSIAVRKRMKLTMSCDHRVIDGATGATFLQTVKQMLENPLAIVW